MPLAGLAQGHWVLWCPTSSLVDQVRKYFSGCITGLSDG